MRGHMALSAIRKELEPGVLYAIIKKPPVHSAVIKTPRYTEKEQRLYIRILTAFKNGVSGSDHEAIIQNID